MNQFFCACSELVFSFQEKVFFQFENRGICAKPLERLVNTTFLHFRKKIFIIFCSYVAGIRWNICLYPSPKNNRRDSTCHHRWNFEYYIDSMSFSYSVLHIWSGKIICSSWDWHFRTILHFSTGWKHLLMLKRRCS